MLDILGHMAERKTMGLILDVGHPTGLVLDTDHSTDSMLVVGRSTGLMLDAHYPTDLLLPVAVAGHQRQLVDSCLYWPERWLERALGCLGLQAQLLADLRQEV